MICKPQFRLRDGRSLAARTARGQQPRQYTPLQVAQAYGLPTLSNGGSLDGSGQTIGIIELGGSFSQSDLSSYLRSLGLPDNQVQVVPVGGASIQPDPGGADVEVMLDVCIIAALAPKARIRVYFADNTSADSSFAAAIDQAVSECDVVSISWGGPESGWSSADRSAMDRAFQSGIAAGVNCYVAAGDNGSSDGTNQTVTDYPASSPYAIACGGTNLQISGGSIQSETVWNDGSQGGATGGGFSRYYAKPSYQGNQVPGNARGVPDVAGVADPETGWIIMVGGQLQSVGGTSAVAPMWAAINALLNQQAGRRIGFADLLYYAHPEWFRDTISGNNGAYQASPNWDACTGLGSPKGSALFAGTTAQPSPPPAPLPPPPPTPLPPPSPVPLPPPTWPTWQEILALLEALLALIEQVSGHGKGSARTLETLISEKESTVDKHEENELQNRLLGLPPGTLIGLLLPVILKVLGKGRLRAADAPVLDLSGLQQVIDNLLTQLEGMLAGHPWELLALKMLHGAIDSLFGSQAHAFLGVNLTPDQIKTLADFALDLAAKILSSNPAALAIIGMLKTAIDSVLASKGASFAA